MTMIKSGISYNQNSAISTSIYTVFSKSYALNRETLSAVFSKDSNFAFLCVRYS
jgi:hypothetical protein